MNEDQTQVDDEQAAFLAEMAQQEVKDEPVAVSPEPEPVAGSEPKNESVADDNSQQQDQAPAPQYVTQQELDNAMAEIAALKKAIDTTNGTYGARLAEQKKIIDELKSSRGSLTADKLKRISEEFGEDMAEVLAHDLNEYLTQGASSSFDAEPIRQEITSLRQLVVEKEQLAALKMLTKTHSDWREIAAYQQLQNGAIAWNNPQFAAFVATLPTNEQQQLIDGWDADFIADKLTDFKESIKPKVVNKQKIEAAVLPRGAGGKSVSSELDEEEAAFRAEMRS